MVCGRSKKVSLHCEPFVLPRVRRDAVAYPARCNGRSTRPARCPAVVARSGSVCETVTPQVLWRLRTVSISAKRRGGGERGKGKGEGGKGKGKGKAGLVKEVDVDDMR